MRNLKQTAWELDVDLRIDEDKHFLGSDYRIRAIGEQAAVQRFLRHYTDLVTDLEAKRLRTVMS